MEFCNIINELKAKYKNNCTTTKNGALLLAPKDPQDETSPSAKHIIYAPMTEKTMDYLVQSYVRTFPSELLKIYQVANGMDLFQKSRPFVCKKKLYYLCVVQLAIYGVPYWRPTLECPEPYNISLEDLSRLPGTPDNLLKFGSYSVMREQKVVGEFDLFTDVECGKTYAIPREGKKAVIQETWESVDQCLCDLVRRISSHEMEDE